MEFIKKLKDIRKTILYGTHRSESSLNKLYGQRDVLETLMEQVEKPLYEDFYKEHIDSTNVSYMIWPRPVYHHPELMTRPIVFPPPKDININMMPVKLGAGIFHCLPENCQPYAPFIWKHGLSMPWYHNEEGQLKHRIGYLTIQEGWVPVGEPQRRPGLHIERPGKITCGGVWHSPNTATYREISWGMGCIGENGLPEEGIFMASTVDHSCAIWDVLIDKPEEVSDKHGGIEPMRSLLGEPRLLRANEMCWFTDRTPHESLPIQAPKDNPTATHVYRQFFRLVVGPISVWYSKHNTPNPCGIQPDAIISDEDKFEMNL